MPGSHYFAGKEGQNVQKCLSSNECKNKFISIVSVVSTVSLNYFLVKKLETQSLSTESVASCKCAS